MNAAFLFGSGCFLRVRRCVGAILRSNLGKESYGNHSR